MTQLLLSIISLALVQALIPNHWLPLVALAKAEKWRRSELMLIASISACVHVLGTVIVGIPLGIGGSDLTHLYEKYIHLVAPGLLIIFGLVYLLIHIPKKNVDTDQYDSAYGKPKPKWITVFMIMMFLSPCLEVDNLFHAEGTYGANNIILLALLYAAANIAGVLVIVFLTFTFLRRLNTQPIEKYEKMITGILLVGVGVVSLFIH